MKIFTVAFFGHRYIDNPFRIEDRLEEEIRRLISEHEYVDFLVGRDGEFDQFASSAVLRVRKQYRRWRLQRFQPRQRRNYHHGCVFPHPHQNGL